MSKKLFDRTYVRLLSMFAHHREDVETPFGFRGLLRKWYAELELWNESVSNGTTHDGMALPTIFFSACDTRHTSSFGAT